MSFLKFNLSINFIIVSCVFISLSGCCNYSCNSSASRCDTKLDSSDTSVEVSLDTSSPRPFYDKDGVKWLETGFSLSLKAPGKILLFGEGGKCVEEVYYYTSAPPAMFGAFHLLRPGRSFQSYSPSLEYDPVFVYTLKVRSKNFKEVENFKGKLYYQVLFSDVTQRDNVLTGIYKIDFSMSDYMNEWKEYINNDSLLNDLK